MRVLGIAVHPDDETLGCGGTLLNHLALGDSVHWLVLTAAHEPQCSAAEVAAQVEHVRAVEHAFPFATTAWLRFPTTKLDLVPFNELVTRIREAVKDVRPEVVFVPNRSDAHSDHRVASRAVAAVLKPFHMRSLGIRRVLACEVLSETDAAPPLAEMAFVPNVFVDVSATLRRKIDIMKLYTTELQSDFLPRTASAVQALARVRGATIGVEYAEAFMLIREVR